VNAFSALPFRRRWPFGARCPRARQFLRESVHREERQPRDSGGEIEPGLTLEGKGL
jgi:hypothetical protein